MPVFNCKKELPPKESEVDIIKILRLQNNDFYSINDHRQKEVVFTLTGGIEIITENSSEISEAGSFKKYYFDIDKIKKIKVNSDSVLVRVGGDWNEKHGSYGIFTLKESENPENIGDPVDYIRNTTFDNHFHDCDEFWIIVDGAGEIVTEGKRYKVNQADCIYTKAGDHHDFPIVEKEIKGIWFETSLTGKMREGHLWKKDNK